MERKTYQEWITNEADGAGVPQQSEIPGFQAYTGVGAEAETQAEQELLQNLLAALQQQYPGAKWSADAGVTEPIIEIPIPPRMVVLRVSVR